jgi:hypothetical protein
VQTVFDHDSTRRTGSHAPCDEAMSCSISSGAPRPVRRIENMCPSQDVTMVSATARGAASAMRSGVRGRAGVSANPRCAWWFIEAPSCGMEFPHTCDGGALGLSGAAERSAPKMRKIRQTRP